MISINTIREKIKKRYETNPHIKVSINMTHPKTVVESAEVVIMGVYPNIFRLKEVKNPAACHTVPYTDVLTGRVKISELEF